MNNRHLYSLNVLPISEISADEGLCYRISVDPGQLRSSIEKNNLFNPIMVYKCDTGYIVINGVKRIKVLIDIGYTSVPCQILSHDSLLEAYVYGLKSSFACDSLSLIEKARAVDVLLTYFQIPQETIVLNYFQIIDFPRKENIFSLISDVVKFPLVMQAFLHKHNLPINDCYRIRNIPSEDQLCLISFIDSFQLSYSNIKQLFELIIELAIMDNITIKQVIENEDIQLLYNDQSVHKMLRVQKIKELLQKRRYPDIQSYQELMRDKVKECKLSRDIKLNYCKDLEDERLELAIAFSSESELVSYLDRVRNLVDQKKISEIFELMDSFYK
ncbi:MAG TPA: hypothetical protein DCS13_03320 [Candidatus Margulisbacteria bacterium]|nr:MAG: hypothetical protein A2X43_03415 [Candidatus Margulisbacteria bacterium GWD2_39_127]HAR62471.1 hypothetical protein [Candidatus Margulisiibacteriota bacterium]